MRLFAGVTIFAALALSAVTAALTLAGGASAQSPTLFATVGPGFSIRIADGAGNRLTLIPPGTYTVVVKDQAAEHNFHITGPGGVDQTTDVDGMGTFTWTITFQEGTYHYQCDPHFTTMKGDLRVEAGAPPVTATPPATTTTTTAPPPPPPPAPAPAARLSASVGPGATIVLRRATARARLVAIKHGRVVITVRDLSARDNFHLTGPGVDRATSRAGRTTVTWRLTLRAGIYRYRSDARPSLKGSFRAL